MASDNEPIDFHQVMAIHRSRARAEKAALENADRGHIAYHILAALYARDPGIPTAETACAIIHDAATRLRPAEAAWERRRYEQVDEAVQQACVAYWTPERQAAVSHGRGKGIQPILDGWTAQRNQGFSMNSPTMRIQSLLDIEADEELRKGASDAVRAADAAGREAFDAARREFAVSLGLRPFEADFLLDRSPIGAVLDLRHAYGRAFELLAKLKAIPQNLTVVSKGDARQTMDVDRLFADDGPMPTAPVTTPLVEQLRFCREFSRAPRLTAGQAHLLNGGELHTLTPNGAWNSSLANQESLWRFLEEVGVDPNADADAAWTGKMYTPGGDVPVSMFRYPRRPDGLRPLLVVHPHRMEANKIVLAEASIAEDPEQIDEAWGAWNEDAKQGRAVGAYDGDRNGVRVLMGAKGHARHLALRTAAKDGFENLLDALAKNG